ncbi:MAG: hypothetical protein ACRENZ_07325, partial [Thermodesulfobacteriota bacterium]
FQRRGQPVFDERFLEQLPKQYKRIWIVGRNLAKVEKEQKSRTLTKIKSKYGLLESQHFKKITILLYETLPPE